MKSVVDFTLFDKVFYYVGSLISISLGVGKIIHYFSNRPRIKINSKLRISHYSSEGFKLIYDRIVDNLGKETSGKLCISVNMLTYDLGEYVKLENHKPLQFLGTIKVSSLLESDLLEQGLSIPAQVFFRDANGKKHAKQTIGLLKDGGSSQMGTRTTLW